VEHPSFIPIRFVPENKLEKKHKLIAALDAFVIARAIGNKPSDASIIHGDKYSVFTVKAHTLAREIQKIIRSINSLRNSSSPTKIILNRHCPECGYQSLCRKKVIESNDLSLIDNLRPKERDRLNRKGIFTVNQLSYTFRPRRRAKRLANKPEKYHHSLKALSIREGKIHVVGNPHLTVEGTPVYFDVEGLPDRDFYYLVGVRAENSGGVLKQSFWADNTEDEEHIWRGFIEYLSSIENPVLIHYGSFETVFLRRMCDRYGRPNDDSPASLAIASTMNLLSFIFAQVYFPTYSNGLKEIARFLKFQWSDPSSSGLLSLVWRYQWESSHSSVLREKLITYNSEDCEALSLVTNILKTVLEPDVDSLPRDNESIEIINTNSLKKNLSTKWGDFVSPLEDFEYVNRTAHWDYQHDRIFVRGEASKRCARKPKRSRQRPRKAEIVISVRAPTACPACGKRGRVRGRSFTRTVQDLIFGRNSMKCRIVQYQFQTFICRSCRYEYGIDEWYFHARKWGWNLTAYFIYHIVALHIPQLTMQHHLNRLFDLNLTRSTLNTLKTRVADQYRITTTNILDRIVNGRLVHADETRANIKGSLAYVWVVTNLKEVVYILSESREGEVIQELLSGFKGVLVTDFYAAYETIACPQQKCLIRLMRDLNGEILDNPFDEGFKSIAIGFSRLLRSIVNTIDRYGLKKRFLRKHLSDVDRFYNFLDTATFQSEASLRCKQRFEKNRDCLFTFLHYDNVPWNNNNAEHAVKAFARLRDVLGGSSSKKGVEEYLTLLSISQTCEYQGLDFLDFLRSEEKDVDIFARKRTKASRSNHTKICIT
jgi:predicted RecB family nuclease